MRSGPNFKGEQMLVNEFFPIKKTYLERFRYPQTKYAS
jgi:hypothetical protein